MVPEPQLILYGPRGLPLVEKVARGLRVKRLDFELVVPAGPEDYARLSPKTGLLPVLGVDGDLISDSSAILDFLDERFPEPPFLSADPRVAREQRRLESWMDETFKFYILRWIRSGLGDDTPASAPGGGFPLVPMSRIGAIDSEGRLRTEVFAPDSEGPGAEFERRLADLDQMLGARPFFFADQIGRADLSVCGSLSILYRGAYPGSREHLASQPRLFAHVERVLDATGGRGPV